MYVCMYYTLAILTAILAAISAAISRRFQIARLNYWLFKSPENRRYTPQNRVWNRSKNRQCKRAIRANLTNVDVHKRVKHWILMWVCEHFAPNIFLWQKGYRSKRQLIQLFAVFDTTTSTFNWYNNLVLYIILFCFQHCFPEFDSMPAHFNKIHISIKFPLTFANAKFSLKNAAFRLN